MNQLKEKIMSDHKLFKLLITVGITLSICTSLALFIVSWPLIWHWSIKVLLFGTTVTSIITPLVMEAEMSDIIEVIKKGEKRV